MSRQNAYRFPFASYPAVRIALLLAAGIICSQFINLPQIITGGILAFGVVLFVISHRKFSKELQPRFHHRSLAIYLLLIFLFGLHWSDFHAQKNRMNSSNALNAFVWEEIDVWGDVYNIKPTSTGKYQVDIQVDSTRFPGTPIWQHVYNLRTVLDPDELALPNNLQLGSRINLTATIYPLDEQRNPHQFNYKAYLASQNIYLQAGIETINTITNSTSYLRWSYWRQQILDLIDQNFDEASRPLAKALLIGYKNELDREQKIAFSRAGLSHIMAVSGLHVGFIIAPFWILIPWFWTFRYGKQAGLLILLSTLIVYAGITGFSASVCRASLTGAFLTYGRLFHKIRDSINLTAVSAIILLLINPADIWTPGFQLSFSAVYIILLIMPTVNHWLPAWIAHRWYGTPIMVVIVSLFVQVGLFPLLAYHFGEFSLIGPLANAVVVPWLGILVPFALLLLPVTSLLPSVGPLLNVPNAWFLNRLTQFIDWSSQLEWSWMQVHLESMLIFPLWIAAIFVIATLRIPRLKWKMVICFLSLLAMQSGLTLIQKTIPATLEITIFDVGQGDAALVSTPNGAHFLIDSGRWSPGYNSARYVILPHLKQEGIEKLDAVFLSHPHADHIGGIVELINEIPIDTIYNSGYRYDSKLYERYHRSAAEKGIPVQSIEAGTSFPLDPAILLMAYGPDRKSSAGDPNEHSLVLEIVYGNTEFLFTGDAGKQQERRLLSHYGSMLDTDILKIGHHGSRTSSSIDFLEATSPLVSIVSLAKSNRYKHPHPEAVQRIRDHSDETRFTSMQRALIFTSDGTKIRQLEW